MVNIWSPIPASVTMMSDLSNAKAKRVGFEECECNEGVFNLLGIINQNHLVLGKHRLETLRYYQFR